MPRYVCDLPFAPVAVRTQLGSEVGLARNASTLAPAHNRMFRARAFCADISIRMRTTTILLATIAVTSAACNAGRTDKGKGNDKAPPTATAQPSPAQARSAPTPAPAPTDLHREQVGWSVDGQGMSAELVTVKDKDVVRVTSTDGKTFDIYTPNLADGTLRLLGHDILFKAEEIAGRFAEVGAVYEREAALIRWDPADHKPVVVHQWTCDESAQASPCESPSWSSVPEDPAHAVMATDQQARELATAFLESGARGDAKAIGKLMAKNVWVSGGTDNEATEPATCPKNAPDDELTRARAAACAAGVLKLSEARALEAIVVERPGASSEWTIGGTESSRIVHIRTKANAATEGPGTDVELVIDLVDGKPLITGTRVYVAAS